MKMMTLKRVCAEISLESLFFTGGTFTEKEVERLLTIDTIRYDRATYAKECKGMDIGRKDYPIWYVNRPNGIVFYCANVAPMSEYRIQTEKELADLERINAIWQHLEDKHASK